MCSFKCRKVLQTMKKEVNCGLSASVLWQSRPALYRENYNDVSGEVQPVGEEQASTDAT